MPGAGEAAAQGRAGELKPTRTPHGVFERRRKGRYRATTIRSRDSFGSKALTVPPRGRGPRYDVVGSDRLRRERRAVPAAEGGAATNCVPGGVRLGQLAADRVQRISAWSSSSASLVAAWNCGRGDRFSLFTVGL